MNEERCPVCGGQVDIEIGFDRTVAEMSCMADDCFRTSTGWVRLAVLGLMWGKAALKINGQWKTDRSVLYFTEESEKYDGIVYTFEKETKWYNGYLIDNRTQMCFESQSFYSAEHNGKSVMSCDNIPNPNHIREYAARKGVLVDQQAFYCMMWRYHNGCFVEDCFNEELKRIPRHLWDREDKNYGVMVSRVPLTELEEFR